jgi:APA family basic amino acid/polyamine antiporter
MPTAPRVFFAMANDNLFFKKLAEVDPWFGTPAAAILALGVWSSVLASAAGFASYRRRDLYRLDFLWTRAASISRFAAQAGRPIPYRVPGYPPTLLLYWPRLPS